jgi:L-lactate dehydrogenase
LFALWVLSRTKEARAMSKTFFLDRDMQGRGPTTSLRPRKGVIIGAGSVGMACAYAMLIRDTFDVLVLQDVNREKAEGEVMDLAHGVPFVAPVQIRTGTLSQEGRDADIVVITAGAKQKPGETRLDLVQRNVGIFRELMADIAQHCRNAVVLVVSNPVDVMTYVAWKLSGFPSSRVLGSGTVLDTARFRTLLAAELGIDPRNVHAYVIGEHGDSEVAAWSKVNVAGVRLNDLGWNGDPQTLTPSLKRAFENVRSAAYEIIRRKGYTSYAIGLATTEIAEAILRDREQVLTVSTLLDDVYGIKDVFLGYPTVVNRHGATRLINLALSPTEQTQLQHSARTLQRVIGSLTL